MKDKIIIGITGGSGTGKSTVLSLLSSLGVYVIDADKTARDVVKPHRPALLEIREHFGEKVINPDGTLARKKLGDIVFSDKKELDILNKITHKYIKEDIIKQAKASNSNLIAIEAAVLHSGGLAELCEYTIAVLADKAIRKQRIMERDSLSDLQAENRISSQESDSYYIENCNYYIKNNGDIGETVKKLKKIIDNIGDR